MKFKKNERKKCPFFQEDCLQNDCMLFHEEFKRCQIDLGTFNLFLLVKQLESMKED